MDTSNDASEDHGRTIIHIDMDYFYAQVEEIHNPALKSKPLGVQQKQTVVTSNYIARQFGLKKLMLVSEAKRLCPQLILVNGEDLTKYRQMSMKVFELLHKYTPLVERLGLDENFLDVSNLVKKRIQEKKSTQTEYNNRICSSVVGCTYHYPDLMNFDNDTEMEITRTGNNSQMIISCGCGCSERLAMGTIIAKEIREDILKTIGLTCCAGIAHNKLLAKLIGSQNRPNNQTVIQPEQAENFMRNLDSVHRIPGVGEKTELLLKECGIMSVADLQDCDLEVLKGKFGYESAYKLKQMSLGNDSSLLKPSGKPKSIGLEDSCRPISVRKDVEERFRLLLMRLANQVSEDGRIPVCIKIIIRKFDQQKKTSHRETRQANILPTLFQQLHDGQLMLANGAQEKLLKIIMRLFERVVDMTKAFNITLVGLAFTKFQEKKSGSSSIANFLIKKTDLEVQSVTNLKSDGITLLSSLTFSPSASTSSPSSPASKECPNGDQFNRRRSTIAPSPVPMLMDIETIPSNSDVSDFSETEIEPSPKKTRLGLLIAKRRCLSSSDPNETASPSKLRVSELRLNSRDSEKDFITMASPTSSPNSNVNRIITTPVNSSNHKNTIPSCSLANYIQKTAIYNYNDRNVNNIKDKSNLTCFSDATSPPALSTHEEYVNDNVDATMHSVILGTELKKKEATENNITNSGIPCCPSGVDPLVFKELPIDVQNELITSWRSSMTVAKSNSTSRFSASGKSSVEIMNGTSEKIETVTKNNSGKPSKTSSNTLHRYFVRNK